MEVGEGVKDVCLSLPSVVSRRGVYGAVVPNLSDKEREKLRLSAEIMDKANQEAKQILKNK